MLSVHKTDSTGVFSTSGMTCLQGARSQNPLPKLIVSNLDTSITENPTVLIAFLRGPYMDSHDGDEIRGLSNSAAEMFAAYLHADRYTVEASSAIGFYHAVRGSVSVARIFNTWLAAVKAIFHTERVVTAAEEKSWNLISIIKDHTKSKELKASDLRFEHITMSPKNFAFIVIQASQCCQKINKYSQDLLSPADQAIYVNELLFIVVAGLFKGNSLTPKWLDARLNTLYTSLGVESRQDITVTTLKHFEHDFGFTKANIPIFKIIADIYKNIPAEVSPLFSWIIEQGKTSNLAGLNLLSKFGDMASYIDMAQILDKFRSSEFKAAGRAMARAISNPWESLESVKIPATQYDTLKHLAHVLVTTVETNSSFKALQGITPQSVRMPTVMLESLARTANAELTRLGSQFGSIADQMASLYGVDALESTDGKSVILNTKSATQDGSQVKVSSSSCQRIIRATWPPIVEKFLLICAEFQEVSLQTKLDISLYEDDGTVKGAKSQCVEYFLHEIKASDSLPRDLSGTDHNAILVALTGAKKFREEEKEREAEEEKSRREIIKSTSSINAMGTIFKNLVGMDPAVISAMPGLMSLARGGDGQDPNRGGH